MKFLIYARYKYINDNGAIVLTDLAPSTAKRDDNVYAVHEQYAPTDQEPIGGIESEGEPILEGFTDAAITVLEASELIAAIEQDIAEGNI